MNRILYLIIIKLTLLILFSKEIHAGTDNFTGFSSKDTISQNQLLYNGRIWRDLYVAIKDDQFLFSPEFLPAQVTMNGRTFRNLRLKYDILNDEIITVTEKGHVLQLNREMVDGFSLTYKNRDFNFLHMVSDSLNKLDGYFNILYKGRSALYVKYFKEISKRGPGKIYEDFVQYNRVYITKDGIVYQIRNGRDFRKVVSDKKHEIKEYLRGSALKMDRKSPDTFVFVLEYYDSIR